MKRDILVIEDNETIRLGILETLSREGYGATGFSSGAAALEYCAKKMPPLVITDLRMEGMDGLEVLEKIKAAFPSVEVLLISAFGTVEDAVRAMRLGAADFLMKPFSPDELRIRVKKIFEAIAGKEQIDSLQQQNTLLFEQAFSAYGEILGESDAIQNVLALIGRVADTDSSIMIQGESGTGKELIAKAIHTMSGRAACPFVSVNCGALNDNLLESELFGHERGAFTGAVKKKKGRFELAGKGTLFLDEIGDVSPALQVKLLRVLQEKEFERVGGEETVRSFARVISASNRDLRQLIGDGAFREDLYYRLNVIPVYVPPLRERKEDIPALVRHFLERQSKKHRGKVKRVDNAGIDLLMSYHWPGNIRELENLIERLFVITPESEIESSVIAGHLGQGVIYNASTLEESVSAFEKNCIISALKKANGVKSRAAKILGLSPSHLAYKLEKYHL